MAKKQGASDRGTIDRGAFDLDPSPADHTVTLQYSKGTDHTVTLWHPLHTEAPPYSLGCYSAADSSFIVSWRFTALSAQTG